jgi:rubredoxin
MGMANETAVASPVGRGESTVSYTLPEIVDLDDAGMERWFPHLDGKWSSQTKSLVAHFGAAGLDLNDNWHETSVDWRCGCCGRSKPEIARITSGGILLAHLHYHHDHLREHLLDLLNGRLGTPWSRNVPVEWLPGQDKVRGLVMRFRETLVCDGCNTAEGNAKKALDLPRHFSFTPKEIARFARAKPNAMVEVDVEAARAVWLGVKAEFEDRQAFAGLLVERLASGRLSVERGVNARPEHVPTYVHDVIDRATRDQHGANVLLEWSARQGNLLRERSLSRDGFGKSSRPEGKVRPLARPASAARAPTDADMALFETKATQSWGRTPADWSCPCCGRGKRGILRMAGSGWFAQIRIHTEPMLETNETNLSMRRALYPTHLPSPVVGSTLARYVCSDCDDLRIVLRQKRPGMPALLTIADIAECIGKVRDNEKHRTDFDATVAQAQANTDLSAALSQFRDHMHLAMAMWEVHGTFAPRDSDRAIEPLTKIAHAHGVEIGTVPGALEWMVGQGQTFAAGQGATVS